MIVFPTVAGIVVVVGLGAVVVPVDVGTVVVVS